MNGSPGDVAWYSQPIVLEDQGQLPVVNRKANPRSQAEPPGQGTEETAQMPTKYLGFPNHLWPFAMSSKQPPDSTARSAQQCCFVCFRGRNRQSYAVMIPCVRPRPRLRYKQVKLLDGTTSRKKEDLTDSSFERDSIVYNRMMEACTQRQLGFKRWSPFYGIVDVREVKVGVAYVLLVLLKLTIVFKFRFLGRKDESDRCRVHIYRLNIDELRKVAEATISLSQDRGLCETYVCDKVWHSDAYEAYMEYNREPGIMQQIDAAQQRRNNLDNYYLMRDCAREPQRADRYDTLKGMAQESPITYLK